MALEVFFIAKWEKIAPKKCWTCVVGSNVTQLIFPSKIFLKLNITHAIEFLML
jgi:hypothetical protein